MHCFARIQEGYILFPQPLGKFWENFWEPLNPKTSRLNIAATWNLARVLDMHSTKATLRFLCTTLNLGNCEEQRDIHAEPSICQEF